MKKLLLSILGILVLALGFTACSGGGSNPPPPPPATYSISGSVNPSTVIAVTGSATQSVTAGSAGTFVVSNLGNGTYALTPSLSGFAFAPASRTVVVNSASVTDANFTGTILPPNTYSISGKVTGASNVIITWSTGIGSVTTDASGNYTIPNLSNGSFTVTPTLSGYSFTPVNQNVTVSNANVTGVNFVGTITPPSTYTISGTVSGATVAGVKMSLSPTGATTNTAANGTYSFTGVSNGNYFVTPTLSNEYFTPASVSVSVINASVAGVNFTGTSQPPTLATGKLLFPCLSPSSSNVYAVWMKDLATGNSVSVGGASAIFIDKVVSFRTSKKFSYRDQDGIWIVTLPSGSATLAMPVGFTEAPGYLSYTMGNYDLSPLGDFAAAMLQSTSGKKDIFLIKTDGSMFYVQVTTDGINTSPVIAGVDASNVIVTVLFIKNSTEIWKVSININTSQPVAPATLFISNVMDSSRAMSVSADYTKLAFMKTVNGVPHLTVIPVAGGTELDLGIGVEPYWALDGSNKLLYHGGTSLWVVNADGSNKLQVPTQTNPSPITLGDVIFGPAGF